MQRILVICCLGLLGACGAGKASTTAAPPPRAAPVARAQPVDRSVPKPAAEVPLTLEPDQQEAEEDAILRKAISLYEQFIDRARSDSAYAEAVRRSRERIVDIRKILEFRAQGRRERARPNRGAE